MMNNDGRTWKLSNARINNLIKKSSQNLLRFRPPAEVPIHHSRYLYIDTDAESSRAWSSNAAPLMAPSPAGRQVVPKPATMWVLMVAVFWAAAPIMVPSMVIVMRISPASGVATSISLADKTPFVLIIIVAVWVGVFLDHDDKACRWALIMDRVCLLFE